MNFASCRLLLLGLLLSLASTIRAQSFQSLSDLPGGGSDSQATGMSPDGSLVVGRSWSGLSTSEAFLWSSDAGMTALGFLPTGDESIAHGVTNSGSTIIGLAGDDTSPLFKAVRWTNATNIEKITGFPPTTRGSWANAMTPDAEVIVGRYRDDFGDHAFRWTSVLGAEDLGDFDGGNVWSLALDVSNDGSVVVGEGSPGSDNGGTAFRWTSATGLEPLGDLPGGNTESRAFGVSADGTVIVGSSSSEFGDEAFLWTESEGIVGLGDLPGGLFRSVAYSVSGNGRFVVGSSSVGFGPPDNPAPFIWDAVHGMRDLEQLLVDEYGLGRVLRGWDLNIATAISDNGRVIVGNGTNPAGNPEAWRVVLPAYAVPEPGSVVLGAVLCLGLLLLRTRREGCGEPGQRFAPDDTLAD